MLGTAMLLAGFLLVRFLTNNGFWAKTQRKARLRNEKGIRRRIRLAQLRNNYQPCGE